NRGFSAPVTLSVEQDPGDRFFLARHDSDPVARWQACHGLLSEALIAALRRKPGEPPRFSADLTEVAGAIAEDERLEHAYRALALALPGEAEIARQIGQNIDPDAIHFTREALASAMARANGQNFRRKYEELDDTRPFSPDAASAG